MASTSASMSTPRRPGGARPRPLPQPTPSLDSRANAPSNFNPQHQASRPAPSPYLQQPPRLSIPSGNVPGINVDQAGEGGWHTPSGLPPAPAIPALSRRPHPPTPSLSLPGTPGASGSATPRRPKLTISSVAPASAPEIFTLGNCDYDSSPAPGPSQPYRLEASRLAPAIPSRLGAGSSRSSTPSLKLAIPLGGSGGSGFSSAYDDDGGSQLLTPVPGEDRDATVHANRHSRVAERPSSEDSGSAFGGLNDMDQMTKDLRETMDRLRFEPSPAPSAQRSRTSSNALEARNNGSLDDDLSKLRLVDLPSSAIDDEPDSRGSSRPNSFHGAGGLFDASDLTLIRHLGEGAGGAVDLVQARDGQVLARKIITRTPNPSMHKQLVRELEFLSSTSSPYIVQNYGAFLAEHDSQICILMEYCEAGSLDALQRRMKAKNIGCSEHVLGRIASSVLRGLDYLQERRIIHRDIKPSNIVLTLDGDVKLCDFGVSGELIESEVNTYMGTALYMAPERIQNKPYSIRADVWSLGVTLLEVAHLRHPFPPEGEPPNPTPFELIAYINILPLPTFVDDPGFRVWTPEIKDFVAQCLNRDSKARPAPRQLLQHPYIVRSESKNVNMAKWVNALVD